MSFEQDWAKVEALMEKATGKKPDNTNQILLVIGIQELGRGPDNFSKEEKQDLLHIGTCAVFATGGYYKLTHEDKDGWPHYELVEKIPHAKLGQQDGLIRVHIIKYFKSLNII